jgi:hypothetical protein
MSIFRVLIWSGRFELLERLARLRMHSEPVVRPRFGNRIKEGAIRHESALEDWRQAAQIADRVANYLIIRRCESHCD